MTTWSIRVLNDELDADSFRFIEVYYDDDGEIIAWSEPHPPQGDNIGEFIAEVYRLDRVAQMSLLAGPRYRILTIADLPPDPEVIGRDRLHRALEAKDGELPEYVEARPGKTRP